MIRQETHRTPVESPRAASRSAAHVILIPERCKGCQFCVAFCPRQVLTMSGRFNSKGYHIPEIVAEERCTDCKLCELLCPDFAIYVLRTDAGGR